jgi:hypothetical protein
VLDASRDDVEVPRDEPDVPVLWTSIRNPPSQHRKSSLLVVVVPREFALDRRDAHDRVVQGDQILRLEGPFQPVRDDRHRDRPIESPLSVVGTCISLLAGGATFTGTWGRGRLLDVGWLAAGSREGRSRRVAYDISGTRAR